MDLSKITPEQWAEECKRRDAAYVDRAYRNAHRIKHALRNYRLWMWHRGEWIDMTPLPLIWFANKASRVVKVSGVKCGAGHHYRR